MSGTRQQARHFGQTVMLYNAKARCGNLPFLYKFGHIAGKEQKYSVKIHKHEIAAIEAFVKKLYNFL